MPGSRPLLAPGGISRRRALGALGGGLGGFAIADVLAGLETPGLHHAPRARRVIQLFMNGGPYPGDLLDPKPALRRWAGQRPEALRSLRTERVTAGLLPSPFVFTRQGRSGLEMSELLPRLARHADELCVLRSVHTDNPNHGPALLLMQNGTIVPTRPSLGAWLSWGLGTESRDLPSYVVLCPGRPVRFEVLWTNAFLPSEHQGVYVNHSDLALEKLLPNLRPTTPLAAQRVQLDLLAALGREQAVRTGPDAAQDGRLRSLETAFRMQVEAADAFDLSRESQRTRERYGSTPFANGCLLARRLSERGVRFVQVYFGHGQPWDTHGNHNALMRGLAGEIDTPIAALLDDLKERGLLDETLVVWGGEFGRTPTSESGDGRDHNHYGFTVWMAGGGVRGGLAYGATDEFGFRAVEDRVHVHDLHATILHLLGIDHERLTYRHAGRDYRLTDVEGEVLREIIA